jgi:hypothetical protein
MSFDQEVDEMKNEMRTARLNPLPRPNSNANLIARLHERIAAVELIRPAFWIKYWRVQRAVSEYLLYNPPHTGKEQNLSEQEVQENFDYFMKVRLDRLAYFQNWLRGKFGVNPSLDGEGILALEAWVRAFGGGLLDDEVSRRAIFYAYDPVWLGKYRSFNVMADIGIFIGEYLISKRPRLHWDILRKWSNDRGKILGTNLNRPVIAGFPAPVFAGRIEDPFASGYGSCADSRKDAKLSAFPNTYYLATLSYHMKQVLHFAGMPDGDYDFVVGDYRDEPL